MESTRIFAKLNFISWILLIQSPWCSGLKPPSFISTWKHMNVNSSTFRTISWRHDLGEDPVYADVQVRSASGYIYPGIGSGFEDDDEDASGTRGGVVFRYSNTTVELKMTDPEDDRVNGYLIFTGQVGYSSDNAESYTYGDVRVRLWRESDFPPPTYTVPDFDITSSNEYLKSHPLGVVPVFTVVQLKLFGMSSSGWLTQAQGTDAKRPSMSGYADGGGTMYGISSTDVRLWTYLKVFTFCDGWGEHTRTDCSSSSAKVAIRMWTCLESDTIFSTLVSHSIYSSNDASTHQVSITSPFNHDEDFIVVRAESTAGSLLGYYFDGVGAAMADTTSANSNYHLGGLVYATNNATQTLRMWHPVFYSSSSYVRCIARASTAHCVTGANVQVAIYRGTTASYTPVLTNAHVVYHKACYYEFACDDPYAYSAGDLTSSLEGGVWTGNGPTCVYCGTVESGINTNVVLEGNVNVNISYTCATGHELVSGNLSRLCVETSPGVFGWNGTPPNCQLNTTTTSTTATTTADTTTAGAAAATTTTKPIQTICQNITASTPETLQEAIEMAAEISKNLTVQAKATGAFKRSLVCAQDTRASAKFVGMIGYVVFGIVLGFILILDGLNVVKFCVDSRNTDEE